MNVPDETTDLQRTVVYRCSCGADVLVQLGSEGECDVCHRRITLTGLDAAQTVSFCAEIENETNFQLDDSPDRSNESLGHFRLISKLGYGGMGAVYRALDESLQRFVAVKVIRSAEEGGSNSNNTVSRFLDEAVAQARLNHPNVVTIYYVGRVGEEPFFAMELLPGPNLGQVIEDQPIPYVDVVHYARQITSALAQANRLGLVHGDIKPGNLILAGERTVKLGDFGLAKTEDSGPSTGISGTLSYMAPELASGAKASAQSDMYSLGVTLFELTFGRRPYSIFGTTLREQLQSQRVAEIEFPDKWPSSVPWRWRTVLERLLARDPNQRYADYDALADALAEHAPVGVTSAGLLNRSLALTVDFALMGILMLPFVVPGQLVAQASVNENFPDALRELADRIGTLSLLAPIVPAIALWSEWRGWRPLGRYLFQLRLVDEHGLRLDRNKRVWRSLIRNAPIWVTAISIAALGMGFNLAVILLSPLDEIIMLINTVPVLGPRRLALHDRLVGSRVVLDTGSPRHSEQ